MSTQWKSFATWPIVVSNQYPYSTSTDTHATEEEAEGVCCKLHEEGFGGERKIFPLKTWVEPPTEPAVPPTAATQPPWLGLGWPQPTFTFICAPCRYAFNAGMGDLCPRCQQRATHERRSP